jgi:hypothetical protein
MILEVTYRSDEQILAIKRTLESIYGTKRIRPRGRHSNRKAVLGHRYKVGTQNDIPWKQAERVAFYQY